MKRTAFITCALVCSLVLAFAAVAVSAESGKALYDSKCARCHGADGTQTKLTGGTVLTGHSAEDTARMLKGYQDGTYGGAKKKLMEAIVKRISEEEVTAISDYVGSL